MEESVAFLQSVFVPRVLVLTTPDAERMCCKSGLNFAELLSPFASVRAQIYLRDPLNQTLSLDSLSVRFVDGSECPVDANYSKRVLGEVVSRWFAADDAECSQYAGDDDDEDVAKPKTQPWFEAWRDAYLAFSGASGPDHEFFTHVLSVVMVISEREQPHESVALLYKKLHHDLKVKLLSSSALIYYVVVHDASESADLITAEKRCEMLRSQHGYSSASVVTLNSNTGPDSSVPSDTWAAVLARKRLFQRPSKTKRWAQTPDEAELEEGANMGGALPCIEASGMPSGSGPSSPPELATEAMSTSSSTNTTTTTTTLAGGSPALQAVVMHPLSPDVSSSSLTTTPHLSVLDPCGGNGSGLDEQQHAGTTTTIVVVNEDGLPNPGCGDLQEEEMSVVGKCLSSEDLESIKQFLLHFVTKALVPYVERQMKVLHDTVGTRKGIHRSIVSATKKWFAPAGRAVAASNNSASTPQVLYAADSPEMQVRKLADLCFMFRHYELAYQAYHNAKRDFDADQAWLHMAGALEMAAVSAFLHAAAAVGPAGMMSGSSAAGNNLVEAQQQMMKQVPLRYLEMAVSSYLNVCRMPELATRTALLSTAVLRARGLWSEAALAYIRLSGEDSDLRSALFLEQAAWCFTRTQGGAMRRKFGFHMVLAGHRFYKSGQKRHTVRAYELALSVYRGRGWQLAEDHINYTIGRQARGLVAGVSLKALLALVANTAGQKPLQQEAFVKEFLLTHQKADEEERNAVQLPLPIILANDCQLLIPGPALENCADHRAVSATSVSFDDSVDEEPLWAKMEELALEAAERRNASPIFQPTLQRFGPGTNNLHHPVAYVGERFLVRVVLKNPLEVRLGMRDVELSWEFTGSGEVVQAECGQALLLEAQSVSTLDISLTVHGEGRIEILGFRYKLRCEPVLESNAVPPSSANSAVEAQGHQLFRLAGPRLNNTKAERCSVVYGVDKRFSVNVVAPTASLACGFVGIPDTMLRNELRPCRLLVRNVGPASVAHLVLVLRDAQCWVVGQPRLGSEADGHEEEEAEDVLTAATTDMHLAPALSCAWVHSSVMFAGESMTVPLWLRAPGVIGKWRSQVLILFQADRNAVAKADKRRRHRILRHAFQVDVQPSIGISGSWKRCPRMRTIQSDEELEGSGDAFNMIVEVKNESRPLSESSGGQATLVNMSVLGGASSNLLNCESQKVELGPQQRHHFFLREERNAFVGTSPSVASADRRTAVAAFLAQAVHAASRAAAAASAAAKGLEEDSREQRQDEDAALSSSACPDAWAGPRSGSPPPASFRGPRINVRRGGELLVKKGGEGEEEEEEKEKKKRRLACVWRVSRPNAGVAWGLSSVELAHGLSDVSGQCGDAGGEWADFLSCRFDHLPETKHDFDRKRVCVVQVRFFVQNCSHAHVIVTVDASGDALPHSVVSAGGGGLIRGGSSISSPFVLVGRKVKKGLSLGPGETSTGIVMKAAFTRPGAYNLAHMPPALGVTMAADGTDGGGGGGGSSSSRESGFGGGLAKTSATTMTSLSSGERWEVGGKASAVPYSAVLVVTIVIEDRYGWEARMGWQRKVYAVLSLSSKPLSSLVSVVILLLLLLLLVLPTVINDSEHEKEEELELNAFPRRVFHLAEKEWKYPSSLEQVLGKSGRVKVSWSCGGEKVDLDCGSRGRVIALLSADWATKNASKRERFERRGSSSRGCGGLIRVDGGSSGAARRGFVSTPGYPGTTSEANCTWTLLAPDNSSLLVAPLDISMREVNLETGLCDKDGSVDIRSTDLDLSLCGQSNAVRVIAVKGNRVTIGFHANRVVPAALLFYYQQKGCCLVPGLFRSDGAATVLSLAWLASSGWVGKELILIEDVDGSKTGGFLKIEGVLSSKQAIVVAVDVHVVGGAGRCTVGGGTGLCAGIWLGHAGPFVGGFFVGCRKLVISGGHGRVVLSSAKNALVSCRKTYLVSRVVRPWAVFSCLPNNNWNQTRVQCQSVSQIAALMSARQQGDDEEKEEDDDDDYDENGNEDERSKSSSFTGQVGGKSQLSLDLVNDVVAPVMLMGVMLGAAVFVWSLDKEESATVGLFFFLVAGKVKDKEPEQPRLRFKRGRKTALCYWVRMTGIRGLWCLSVCGALASFSPSSAEVPIVIWHGLGDSCCNPLSMGGVVRMLKRHVPDAYILSMRIGSNIAEDIDNSYLKNINDQIEMACDTIRNDSRLANGFHAVGFSQGALFMRAIAQRCPSPPIRNLISVGGPQQGVFGLPRCLGSSNQLCELARRVLDHGAYVQWVQNSLVPAQYWQDPFHLDAYRKYSSFLADINNERERNESYVRNLGQVGNLVLVMFNNDSVVQPRESEWFGFYDAGQDKKVHSLQQSALYVEDRLGLKQMEAEGRLKFLRTDGDHLQFAEDWFVVNIIQPYLLDQDAISV
ncbi:unnamed protein product [Notodromas monacha]|uniref:Palmitoyl-protein thioesterase 1 n=1 Tax=Notodromas monacha TaxID=399045 RepID=A0A7R9BE19_9CRUS|nr:unnamed protein product [Notodromas monacha]CAG0912437.1 unnamed protein product [Notodromas monacha]